MKDSLTYVSMQCSLKGVVALCSDQLFLKRDYFKLTYAPHL